MSALAAYASDPTQSRGRLYAADNSPTRSEFQRDRDRILHSTAFRRLQHKTQVFLHHEGRHYRTRLTHTMEVAQIARSLSRSLRLNEDLAEAVALAHDLGHPPFGHAGERVLDGRMKDWGGFDHNVQALRVVSVLENRYAAHDGLNLSWECTEGILKHNGPITGTGADHESTIVAQVLALPLPPHMMLETFAGLEAQTAAIADDIAYNSHDVDDSVRAGILRLEDMVDVALVGPIAAEVLGRWPDIEPQRQTHEVQRRLITRMIEAVIAESSERIAALAPGSPDAARNAGQAMVGFPEKMASEINELKQYLFENVYRSEAVMVPVREGEGVVGALFDHLLETLDLPGVWREAAEKSGTQAGRARVVADFVAGMTDPYALEVYQRIFDAKPQFS